MSAITGVFGKSVNEDQLKKMVDTMKHRGPDNFYVLALNNSGAAASEINISSRSTAAMAGSEYPVVLFDGDIYNEDIPDGKSNAEYIREQYIQKGKSCFSGLEGSFACAVIEEKEALLARDHVGSRPVIYNHEDGVLYFSSEAKGLLGLVDSVEELPPGKILSSRDGMTSFDGFMPSLPDFETAEEAAEILEKLLVKAVEKRMNDGAVRDIALSGGLDSSIIASVAKSINPDIRLFSTTIKRSPSKDIKFAKLMAEYLDLEHKIYEISDQELQEVIPEAVWVMETFDEDCISGAVANYYTSKYIKSNGGNCILCGEGADELFGGYFRELKDIPDEAEKERIAKKLVQIAYNTALRRLDRAWMANSIHYRTPFLDPEVVEFSNKIPMGMKVKFDETQNRPVEKWILRQAMRKWLPEEVFNRPKLRFAGGTGVDDIIAELTADKASEEDLKQNPVSNAGLKLFSPRELYFYRLFKQYFPADGYETMIDRWDPFK